MKKIIALLLALASLLSMAGCMETPQPETTTQAPTTPATTEPKPVAADLQISEVMPDNKFLVMGHENDWVELMSREETTVSLDGYYLTDDPEKPDQMPLKGLEIPAGGYLTIVLDDAAPFRLSADGETVYLFFHDQLLGQVTYGLSENGESYDADGPCQLATPGYANTQEGYEAYLQSVQLPELYISEVLSSNSKYLPVKNECYDLVEVKNGSNAPINLGEYTLTDKRSEPYRYAFPEVTLQPGEYFVVYCSDDASLGAEHAPFKISASGENIYLAKGGKIVDALVVPGNVQKNQSYGRDGNIPAYFAAPTPGADNAAGYRMAVEAPRADQLSGVYGESVTVTLSATGTIYYTLDGSRPTTQSKVYTDPIVIDGITTIRTFCVEGERSSPITAYTYLVDAQHDLPIVSIAIPQNSLTGSRGVLNHIDENYEHEGVLTLIEDGEEKFSVPFGFRLHGNDSRKGKKQNFQLRFRSEYGAGKLEYPVFDDRDIQEYDSLLLKGGSEDHYVAMMRDEVFTGIANGTTELYTQAMKPVVLYLGGQYWGVYYLRERFSDEYVASHMNVSPESVDIAYSTAAYTQVGSNKDFLAVREYALSHDMTKAEHYQYIKDRVDVISLMDWYICRSYVADNDIANIRRCRSVEADGKWHWMYFDVDWGFCWIDNKPISNILDRYGADNAFMRAVLTNKEARDTFIKRYAELMRTVLNEEYIVGYIDNLVAQIDSEMPRDRSRWNNSYERWQNEVQKLRDYVKDGKRTRIVINGLRSYFYLNDEQMEYYFGDLMQ